MSAVECLPPDPSVAVGYFPLHMEPALTAILAGLLIGLVWRLVNVRVREPSAFALIGLVVMLFGHITAYSYPFGVWLLLGRAYVTFEEGWYGSGMSDSSCASYRVRLFVKNSVAGSMSRYLRGWLRFRWAWVALAGHATPASPRSVSVGVRD